MKTILSENLSVQNISMQKANVSYVRDFYSEHESASLFEILKSETQWECKQIQIFGRKVWEPRLSAWYGESGTKYTYSGVTLVAKPWFQGLYDVRQKIEKACGETFNSVLLNYYRSGEDSMGLHSDDEPELGAEPIIASLSLGGERIFRFKPKKGVQKDSIALTLHSGSLLLMGGTTQDYWAHEIPKTKKPVGERINLTFRQIQDLT